MFFQTSNSRVFNSMNDASPNERRLTAGGVMAAFLRRRARNHALLLLLGFVVISLPGCSIPRRIRTPQRYSNGVVFVLPGIEGRSVWNRDIALGLDEGGVRSAIELYDWTTGVPGGFVVNLAYIERNRREAKTLADKIVNYRQRYPGNPVHIVGHSAGAGIAVLALEALPPGRQIDSAILLAPALSPEHNLCTALRRTRYGIVNFHSEYDIGFLKLGTSVFGSVDREWGSSAGAVGFDVPADLSPEDRVLYDERLKQVKWNPRLKAVGASGSHLGWASRQFATEYLAPLIIQHEVARPVREQIRKPPTAAEESGP